MNNSMKMLLMRGWEKIRVNCVTGESGFQHLAAFRTIWIPVSGKLILVESRIWEIFASEIRNPGPSCSKAD